MKKQPSKPPPRHIGDDYTPENVSGATLFGGGIILVLIVLGIFFAIKSRPKDDQVYIDKKNHIVIDREAKSIAERPPLGYKTMFGIVRGLDLDTARFKLGNKIYSIDGKWFTEGDTLTSKENGALILWDTTMPESWIIGVITDSGTIDYSPFEIKPK